jgi:hypothetical protein
MGAGEGAGNMITRREFVKGVAGVAVTGALLEKSNGEDLVASCGLYCGACPMYLATQNKDEQRVKTLMQQFSSGKMNWKMEDLLCDGCRGNGRLATFCRKCAIRESAAAKTKTKLCSECPDYSCSRITAFNNDGMLHHAEVLANLRQLKAVGLKEWAKREEERWACPQCRGRIAWYEAACPKCSTPRSDRLFPLKKA